MRFEFEFDYPLAASLAAFGILPGTSNVDVAGGELVVKFGRCDLRDQGQGWAVALQREIIRAS